MRLIRLALTNFRQHADTEIEFRPGLTGIIGPNGSGKTTILEAIAWAIYGSQAVRGTNDTLRFNRAPGRSTVKADLEFELAGDRYRVARTSTNAHLYLGNSEDPIAAGIGEVTRQLTRRLGMERDEFFNTYFTGQKELQFLAAMTPAERARFLSQVLGYERLRSAQSLVRSRRNELRGEIEALRSALGEAEAVEAAREKAEERLKNASADLEDAQQHESAARERLAEIEPQWKELQSAREQDNRYQADLRVSEERLRNARERAQESQAELQALSEVEGQLERLRDELKPLPGLEEEQQRLASLAEAEEKRRQLTEQLQRQRQRVSELSERAKELEARASRRAELAEAAAELKSECDRLEAERDEARDRWQRDRQDAEAQIRMLRDQAGDLKEQIRQLEEAGPDGVCPTCQRPLGAEYEVVLTGQRERYEEIVQDGGWLKQRVAQLNDEPKDVAEAGQRLARMRKQLDETQKELSEAESAVERLQELGAELEREQEQARQLAGARAELPEGYDAEAHRRVQDELKRLRELEKKATQLETRLESRERLKRERAEAKEEADQVQARIAELESAREQLGFSGEAFAEMRDSYEAARSRQEEARLAVERARGEVEAAREAADAARRAEREYRERAQQIVDREKGHRLHNELDAALGQLREELNARVRPELSEIASVFLTELTDGRYNEIVIDDRYQVTVLDDGEEKPVISGGEEDLANLVLRLAISQMIADRAGQTLSLLIFDEVFGGLDDLRRESVVRLLQRLQDRFEQVVLITHIESIREGMDQVIRASFDPTSGATVVTDESPAADRDLDVEELAAMISE